MTTRLNKPCIGERSEGTTRDHAQFIDCHRRELLLYLDGMAPGSAEEFGTLGYIESVLTAWQEIFGKSDLTDPGPEERTFWFALYQLEELVENSGPLIDPYEKLLMENLVEIRELLRHRRSLPAHRFMATRPNGT